MEKNFLNFIAASENREIIDSSKFSKVISSVPNDCAEIIKEKVVENEKITLISFGPTTKTSKSYLFGASSVLSTILSFYIDAQIPIKLFVENSTTRIPEDLNSAFSITSNEDFPYLFEKTDIFPETDFIKISLFVDKKIIILLYIPSFPPFDSSAQLSVKLNGWEFLQKPNKFVTSNCFAVLHFDESLQTENQALQMLVQPQVEIEESEVKEPENEVPIKEQKIEEQEPEPKIVDSDSVSQVSNESHKHKHHHHHRQGKEEPARSEKTKKQRNENNKEDDASSVKSAASGRSNASSVKSVVSKQSVASKYSARFSEISKQSANPMRESELETGSNAEQSDILNQDDFEEAPHKRKRVKKTKRVRRESATQPNNQDEEKYSDTMSSSSYINEDNENKAAENRKHQATEANEGYYDSYDSYSYSDQEKEQEEEEETAEEMIHKFAYDVEFNIPALQDNAVYATLFNQLFFEKWKGGALKRAEDALLETKEHIRKQRADETANLKALVQSGDLSVFIAREEQKLRLLESKTVETLELLLNHQIELYAGTTMQSLYKNFKVLCAQQIEQQRVVRQKRSEIRSKAMDLRMREMKRVEKLEKKQKKDEKLNEQKKRLTKALEAQNSLTEEVDGLVEVRDALIAQKEKVTQLLLQKRAEKEKQQKK